MSDLPMLTKADAAALWHAVQNYGYMVRAMPDVKSVTPEQIEVETRRLEAAQAALRKVQAQRRAAKRGAL